MNFDVAENDAGVSTDDQAASERNDALRLLRLTDSLYASVPILPNLPETNETETCGFAVRVGSST
jgi:hypothetical protein